MVNHPENEQVSENWGDGGEIGPKKGKKGGGRGEKGLFSGQLPGRDESLETGILSVS